MQFDHERLDVYRTALDFCRFVADLQPTLGAKHKHIRDQLLRASLSIPLNIAEGNGKRPGPDRKRFLDISRGSANECAAALDVLVVSQACTHEQSVSGKALLFKVVCMLTKMMDAQPTEIREAGEQYFYPIEGAKQAEYEDEREDEQQREPMMMVPDTEGTAP